MKTYQEKAEQYVRTQLPELMELSLIHIDENTAERFAHQLSMLADGDFMKSDGAYFMRTARLLKGRENLGPPILLNHWLRVLVPHRQDETRVGLICTGESSYVEIIHDTKLNRIDFNLTTGQPATEADFKTFCEIVGVNQD